MTRKLFLGVMFALGASCLPVASIGVDAATVKPLDASVDSPRDASVDPQPDASVADPEDASTHVPDASVDSPDASTEVPDASVDVPDASVPPTTFHDSFNTFTLHHPAQASDTWALITPSSTFGRGGPSLVEEGDQWWVNPMQTETNGVGDDLYLASGGALHLGLANTPSQVSQWIDSQAGTHLPYIGTLLNTVASFNQKFGYFEVEADVDAVPGLAFQACLESWENTHHWPPELDMRVNTHADGSQSVHFRVAGSNDQGVNVPITAGSRNRYGVDWRQDFIRFYLNRTMVHQVATPKDGYYSSPGAQTYWYLLTGAHYVDSFAVAPDPNQLPAFANVYEVNVWAERPF